MLRHHVVPIGYPAWRWSLDGLTPKLVYSGEESEALGDRWVDYDPAVVGEVEEKPIPEPLPPNTIVTGPDKKESAQIDKPRRGRPKKVYQ